MNAPCRFWYDLMCCVSSENCCCVLLWLTLLIAGEKVKKMKRCPEMVSGTGSEIKGLYEVASKITRVTRDL